MFGCTSFTGETVMAKKSATTRKRKVAAKKAKKAVGSTKYETMIVASVAAENPRRKGTKAAKLFDAMASYVRSHRNVKVSDLIAATDYSTQDFNWDLKRGHVAVRAAR
jgi:hypothetical protein